VAHAELKAKPRWHETGDKYFPAAARVGGEWWVLRLNNFPDHPLWTLIVDGQRRFDLDDVPPTWGKVSGESVPRLSPDEAEEALGPVREWRAYGSEVGRPCDNPFCCHG
jgi:hypothetical protein